MKKGRKKIINWLFEKSQTIYTRYFKKNKPWEIRKLDLLKYSADSLGNHLGQFLEVNGFELIPKVERHDVYHVITNYGINAEDEIALQYLCFGNGKRSLYLFAVIILGTIILPDYLKYYYDSYCIGKKANAFYHYDFSKLLEVPLSDFRQFIFRKKYYFNYNQKT